MGEPLVFEQFAFEKEELAQLQAFVGRRARNLMHGI